MTPTAMDLLERVPEETQITLLAVATLWQRVRSLPRADQDALFDLVLAVREAADEDDRRAIQRAMVEILERRPMTTRPAPLDAPMPTVLKTRAEQVGRQIRALRDRAGLTLAKLADQAGLPLNHVSRLEDGEHSPTYLTLEKIANALGVAVRDLDPAAE